MRIYRIATWAKVFDGKVYDGDMQDQGTEEEMQKAFRAIKMKDGTIYYGASHYDIVARFSLNNPINKQNIESYGNLWADGTYDRWR